MLTGKYQEDFIKFHNLLSSWEKVLEFYSERELRDMIIQFFDCSLEIIILPHPVDTPNCWMYEIIGKDVMGGFYQLVKPEDTPEYKDRVSAIKAAIEHTNKILNNLNYQPGAAAPQINKSMNTEEIKVAALEHAKTELGEAQFNNNESAVNAISHYFEKGAEWHIEQLKLAGSLKNLKSNWANLSDDEKGILGRPNFMCGQIARRMRELGFECNEKAEDEQAMVIFTMLQFYKQDGEKWADNMEQYLKGNPDPNSQ